MCKNLQAQSLSSQLGRRVLWGTHQAETGKGCQFCILERLANAKINRACRFSIYKFKKQLEGTHA
jgi:hypothetical protein